MSKKKTQKIIIPKGTINPNEDTLIEIPTELKEQPIVVAKKDGYQEKNVSIETTSKNIVYEGNKYSVLEDSSRVNIVDTRDRSFTPRREKSLRKSAAHEVAPPVFPSNEARRKEDVAIGRKLDDLLRAKKELQETALLATKTPQLSNVSCQICPSSGSEISTKRKRSTLSNTFSGENVRQHSRTQSTGSCTVSSKGACSYSDQYPAATSQDVPPFTSTKRSEVQVSRSLPTSSSVATTASTEEKEEEKRISFRVDKETSDICLQGVSSKSSNPPCQDKEVQSASRNMDEPGSEEIVLPRRKRSKDNCKKCKRASKKESLTERDSATSWREDRIGSDDRFKKCDKCSSNEIDDIYIEQLKRQFEDAKRKLDDAVMLASMSLKKLSSKRYSPTSRASAITCKASSICDTVPERDVSFIPLCGSKQSYMVFVPSSTKNSCRIMNQEENKVPSYDFTPSDSLDRNDIYKNIITRRATDELRKSPVQNESDSPCSFLKSQKSDNSNSISTTKDDIRRRSAEVNKTSPITAACRYPAQRENDVPCPALNATSPASRIIREKRQSSDSQTFDRAYSQRESPKVNDSPLRISVPLVSTKDINARDESTSPLKKPELILKEKVVQTEKTALSTRISRCSCSKIKDSGSIKFVKEPQSNFSNSSGIDQAPSLF